MEICVERSEAQSLLSLPAMWSAASIEKVFFIAPVPVGSSMAHKLHPDRVKEDWPPMPCGCYVDPSQEAEQILRKDGVCRETFYT